MNGSVFTAFTDLPLPFTNSLFVKGIGEICKYCKTGDAKRELAARLERGWALIEQAEVGGDEQEVERLTGHWITLLAEYQKACDAEAGGSRHEH